MTSAHAPEAPSVHGVGAALAQRLRAVAPFVVEAVPDADPVPQQDAGTVLTTLVEELRSRADASKAWLVWTALTGAFPTHDELASMRRHLELTDTLGSVQWLLEAGLSAVVGGGSPDAELEVLDQGVVVDVDFCATSDHHTGIQRVVRETVPRWVRDHDLTLVAWTAAGGATRRLTGSETDRVIRWGTSSAARTVDGPTRPRLVVPWRSVVVFPENPEPQRCPALAALAELSGNTATVLGYDCIPVVSPELIHPGLPDRFMRYLHLVKHARTVAAISSSARDEFEGFSQMMGAQGLTGPAVVEVALPMQVPEVEARPSPTGAPLVIAVGSFEPRKNQLAVLHAAERLWREGHRFRLRFIGGGGWRTEFDAELNRLAARGRDVDIAVRLSDRELWQAFADARFTVFASLHEGYGLPVAESLAHGTPALTTGYGSTAEIAAEGGALTVDPRDDDALMAGMRRLLTDDDLLCELEAQAASRPTRTWDDYAAESWRVLVAEHVEETA
ncbi:Glycosyltransferase involved in cell wall bisynthesis [Klenkia marina]|uniref:Glycosyltransferase involved in cell wall bisynthesis n=1 Tax=Klenkia marina TaxID=1960309 RepID=A0A1G4YE90_9ACTN|nr:glycosyltransferase [Klenkia marina]SCX51762.1 Glycosyltransferase involved in cell wall bisynthesis [Klenkia marina]